MASRARIILMDEPTSSLQRDDVRHLFALIARLKRRRNGVIYISHFLEEVGRSPTVHCAARRPQRRAPVRSIRDERRAHCADGWADRSTALSRQAQSARRGRRAGRAGSRRPSRLKQASFALRRGEILGIAGLMGSGRTELVRALFGLAPVASGHVRIAGAPVRLDDLPRAAHRAGRRLSQRGPQRRGPGAADVSRRQRDDHRLCQLCALGLARPPHSARRRDAGLASLESRRRIPTSPSRTLSGGNQQKVALGRLLHQEADVLLLDEPTRGIDIGSKAADLRGHRA